MKRSVLKRLFLSGLPLAFLLVSCDVHEFPGPTEPAKYPVVLDLTFDTELPVYQTVDVKTRVLDDPQAYNLRYTVCIYRADAEGAFGREEERRMVVTKSVTAQPDLRIETQLEEGAYRFIVWTDFVDAGTQEHKFFRTDDFSEVALLTSEYAGSTEFRDAFRGRADAAIAKPAQEGPIVVPVPMTRPQARYSFVSTDLTEFMTRVQALRESREHSASQDAGASQDADPADEPTRSIDLDDFRVVVHYAGYVPSSFNLFTDQTADASTGVQFESRITRTSDSEASLGFDYVLVNEGEASVKVSLEVYGRDGTQLSATNPFDIPLMRGRHTIVRGNFLTSEASGGIGIDPGFDGDWNYPVQ